jgi:hypothetical protein
MWKDEWMEKDTRTENKEDCKGGKAITIIIAPGHVHVYLEFLICKCDL